VFLPVAREGAPDRPIAAGLALNWDSSARIWARLFGAGGDILDLLVVLSAEVTRFRRELREV